MNRRSLVLLELPFLLLALATVVPLWHVTHPAIQDLPQHLATIRALADFDVSRLHFRDYYVIELGRTQYLAYYLITAALAKVVGVVLANKLVLSAAIVGTPYALRWLLRALQRDERAALLVLPLTWNAHLILGFANFVAAIPLALACLALAIRYRQDGIRRHGIGLAALLVLAFYTHVVPFAFGALGVTVILVGDTPRATLERWLTLVPSGLATLGWLLRSPAGQSTLTAARGAGAEGGPQPVFVSVRDSLMQIPQWLTDVLHVERDEQILAAFGVLLLGALTMPGADPSAPRPIVQRARLAVGLLAPLAALAYFVTPDSYDWIWPIHARFPLLALVFAIACVQLPRSFPGHLIVGLAALLGVLAVREVDQAFVAFDQSEVGPIDQAIAAIPPGERVVGLVWDRGSSQVKFSPFLHSVAWYQAARGGAVMFTFADFPQSPIRFREDARPPRVWPRWEWTPERVDPRTQLGWYRYALVRGGPGPISEMPDVWRSIGDYGSWHVFRRVRP